MPGFEFGSINYFVTVYIIFRKHVNCRIFVVFRDFLELFVGPFTFKIFLKTCFNLQYFRMMILTRVLR